MKNAQAVLLGLVMFFGIALAAAPPAHALDWHDTFESLCGGSIEDAPHSAAELKGMLAQSEELLKTVDALDIPQKKIYLFRIGKCRDLIKFYITLEESKKGDGAK